MVKNKFDVFFFKGCEVILFFNVDRGFIPKGHTLVAKHILTFFNTAERSPKFLVSGRIVMDWLLFNNII